MRKIVFTNDKGGVGKTMTVATVAVGLADRGHSVLAIDMDQQGDMTYTILGEIPPKAKGFNFLPTSYTLLRQQNSLEEVMIQAPNYEKISVVPSNGDLSAANGELASKAGSQAILFNILKKQLNPDAFDFVLIDTGKGLDLILVNAIAAVDEAIILTSPGPHELRAVSRMVEHIEAIREGVRLGGDSPRVSGILLTKFEKNHSISEDSREQLLNDYPELMFKTVVNKNEDLPKATSRAQSIFEFNMRTQGAKDYSQFVEELLSYGD